MAARRAGAAGFTALQCFTAIPKFYGDKASIRPERVTRFKAAQVLFEAPVAVPDPRSTTTGPAASR